MLRSALITFIFLAATAVTYAQETQGEIGADGTVSRNLRGSALTIPLTPQQWGASPNDDVDDADAFNKMFRWMEANEHMHCVIPPGEYLISTNCILPFSSSTKFKRLLISGYGAVLQTTEDNITIFDRSIDSVTPSPTNSYLPTIEGICFRGQASNTASAGIGIRYNGAGRLTIRECYFNNLNRAMDLIWCINSQIETCQIQGTLEGFVVRNGDGGEPTINEAAIDLAANTIDTDAAHGLETNQRIRFLTDSALPGGLAINTNYYAIVIDSDTLAVSTTINGARVNITSIGVDSGINARRIPGTGTALGGGAALTGEGTQTNSNCNLTWFQNCRDQMTDTAAIGFDILTASQVRLSNCVTEGSDCDIAVRISSDSESGSVTRRDAVIENHWTEFTVSINTIFDFDMRQSSVVIDRMLLMGTRRGSTPDETVFIDDQSSTESVFIIKNTDWEGWNGSTDPWFVNNVPAAAARNSYSFLDNRVATGDDWNDVGLWTNAVPTLYGRTWHTDSDVLDVLP